MSLPLLIRARIILDERPALMTSFNLHYVYKGSITRLTEWVKASTYKTGGNTVHFIIASVSFLIH